MLNKKFVLLLILLLPILYIENVSAELVPIKTYINVSTVSYLDSNNLTKINITIANEDAPIKIDDVGINSSINNQYLIVLIRDLQTNETDITNLTLECLRRVATVDGDALIECTDSKARQFDTIQELQSENSGLRGIDGNLSVCNLNLAEAQSSLGNSSITIGNLRNEIDSAKNNTVMWALIVGVGIFLITYFTFKKKYGGASHPLEQDFGRKSTATPDIPSRFRERMDELKKQPPGL